MDSYELSQMNKTAEAFSRLCGLRGVSACIEVSQAGHYVCNGVDVGTSIHGAYEWLNKQPGVKD